jgi:dolichol-phosphate mannosyltransferase
MQRRVGPRAPGPADARAGAVPWPGVRVLGMLQVVAGAVALRRLARGRVRHPPLAVPPAPVAAAATVSVVIPARDEAERIGPCLGALRGHPDVLELIVVDDGSSDATAAIAHAHGARVLDGAPLPAGWVGKPWALQQGLEAASGDVVVSLDADTRPRPGLVRALAGALEDADLVTAGCRFACDTAGERWLHPAFLATLVYRFGPSDAAGPPPRPGRLLANGQCTAVRRTALLAAGGYALAAGHMTDDAALARGLAARGWRVRFRDGADLITVDMHQSAREVWREWGRSIALPDVTSARWQAADLAMAWLVLALPPVRLLARRAGAVDRVLLAVRWTLLLGLRRTYARRGAAFWLSPLADPLAVLRLTLSALRPPRRWRGREYGGAAGTAHRSSS